MHRGEAVEQGADHAADDIRTGLIDITIIIGGYVCAGQGSV